MARILIYSSGDMAMLVPIVAEAEHSVVEAYDSGEILQLVIRSQFDIIMIPDGVKPIDGQEVLPLIRRLTLGAIIVVGDGDETAVANALLSRCGPVPPVPRGQRACTQPSTSSSPAASPRPATAFRESRRSPRGPRAPATAGR